jgi:hypothetical protein
VKDVVYAYNAAAESPSTLEMAVSSVSVLFHSLLDGDGGETLRVDSL